MHDAEFTMQNSQRGSALGRVHDTAGIYQLEHELVFVAGR